jgi:hypothetical protein
VTLPPEVDGGGVVYRLHKAIYGLKQAPRAWYQHLTAEMKKQGFEVSSADPAVFYRRDGDTLVVSTCHVDDLLTGSPSEEAVLRVEEKLAQGLKIKRLGPPSCYLGMEVQSKDGRLLVTQKELQQEILERFSMDKATPRSLPLDPGTRLSRGAGEPLGPSLSLLYKEMVGSMMYLACCTRPDIAHAVGLLARAFKAPRTAHLAAAKGVMRYLAGTREYGLEFGGAEGFTMYSDSDYAGDPDNRRSTSGYVALLNGEAVSWKTRQQPTVAASTCEAEYQAAGEAVREALWWRKLLPELGIEVEKVMIRGDNQAALAVLENPLCSERVKHIDVIHHFSRERVARGEVAFSYVDTKEMVADIMTKALPLPAFKWCREAMGVKAWN